jgi:hypothetical protein
MSGPFTSASRKLAAAGRYRGGNGLVPGANGGPHVVHPGGGGNNGYRYSYSPTASSSSSSVTAEYEVLKMEGITPPAAAVPAHAICFTLSDKRCRHKRSKRHRKKRKRRRSPTPAPPEDGEQRSPSWDGDFEDDDDDETPMPMEQVSPRTKRLKLIVGSHTQTIHIPP